MHLRALNRVKDLKGDLVIDFKVANGSYGLNVWGCLKGFFGELEINVLEGAGVQPKEFIFYEEGASLQRND